MILHFSNYLFRAAPEDKRILDALCEAFQQNKRTKSLVGNPLIPFRYGLKIIIAYCYFAVKKLNGVFIASNRKTFMLYYKKSRFYSTLLDQLHYLYMVFFVIGIRQLRKVYKREQMIQKIRQKAIMQKNDQDYWYIWFLAQSKTENSLKGLVEAKQHILQLCENSKSPIYMETTEERLLTMYRRVGFQFYAFQEDKSIDLKIWFGRMSNNI